MSKNLFEIASRKKYRFPSPAGLLSVEDLWDLPLTSKTNKPNLDDVSRTLYNLAKTSAETVSFVNPTSSSASDESERLDIVKYIIEVRIAERNANEAAATRAAKKQQILSVIAQKENEELTNASLEDLRKLADEL